ncbi:hypothetical protein N7528_000411 [Penicillium herquei]|nr:hypothetical protein N7528_000411 [Penicillium herquei]
MVIPEVMNGGPHYRSRRIPVIIASDLVQVITSCQGSTIGEAPQQIELTLILTHFFFEAFSINYLMSELDVDLQDPNGAMKIFEDPNTASGNVIERHFCSVCGSAIFSKTPRAPGKVFLKATLFDKISPMEKEVFGDRRLQF